MICIFVKIKGVNMEEMRLQKFIAMCGIASRRGAEKLITDGRISVDGNVITELGTCVTGNETILFDGKRISLPGTPPRSAN